MFNNNKGNSGFIKIFLTALLTSLGVGGVLFFFSLGYVSRNTTEKIESPGAGLDSNIPKLQQLEVEQPTQNGFIQGVAESASQGVVGISVLKVDSNAIFNRNAAEKWGVGSGVIVSPDGYILTNDHVAGGKSKRIIVSLADGRNIDGVTTWCDPILDLAVVKINATGLNTIPLGDANKLKVGEPAIAIGNPLGLQFQRTVTSGIISALNRTIQIDTEQGSNYMEDLIQTDASINPGNSGGPLLNAKGEVIGINTVKVASAEAIGFAIPINVAIPIIKKYIQTGDFLETYMGVFAYDKEVVPYIDNSMKLDNGIYIVHVDENGPAYKSGIRVGCIMTQIDGMEINTMMQLRCHIYSKNPGDTVNITHLSNGNPEVVQIKLTAKEKDGLITR